MPSFSPKQNDQYMIMNVYLANSKQLSCLPKIWKKKYNPLESMILLDICKSFHQKYFNIQCPP